MSFCSGPLGPVLVRSMVADIAITEVSKVFFAEEWTVEAEKSLRRAIEVQ